MMERISFTELTEEEKKRVFDKVLEVVEIILGWRFRAEPVKERHCSTEHGIIYLNRPVYKILAVKDWRGKEIKAKFSKPDKLKVPPKTLCDVEYYCNDPEHPVPEEIEKIIQIAIETILEHLHSISGKYLAVKGLWN